MNKTRRLLLNALGSGLVAYPVVSLFASTPAQAADSPRLSPDDPSAQALNYTHESADAARACSSCQFYTGAAGDAWGPCVIFPETLVSAAGVCNSWYARAG